MDGSFGVFILFCFGKSEDGSLMVLVFEYWMMASDSVAICCLAVGDGFDASPCQLNTEDRGIYFLRSTWDLMPSLMLNKVLLSNGLIVWQPCMWDTSFHSA